MWPQWGAKNVARGSALNLDVANHGLFSTLRSDAVAGITRRDRRPP